MKIAFAFPAGQVHRILFIFLFLLLFEPHGFTDCFAGEFHNSLSLQGYTGLLNTPNAGITEEGRFYALFSNQQENNWRKKTRRQENYMASVGFFSIAELGGRVTDAPKVATDLSANFKIKVPFIPKGYYLPSIAFGMQDFGGSSKKLQTKYVVASEELWRFRLSMGYGAGPDRMKGVFGGIEVKAFDWLYLLGENDTKETNVGIRLISPDIFGYPVNLNVTAKTSLDYRPGSVVEFGFGLQFPLGLDHHDTTPLDDKVQVTHRIPDTQHGVTERKELAAGKQIEKVTEPALAEHRDDELMLLKKALTEAGFQNVEVGSKDRLLVVEYENSRYNHNELDGLGVVAGIASEYAPRSCSTMRLIIRKKGIRTLQLTMPAKELHEFLVNANSLKEFNDSLQITADVTEDHEVSYIKGDNNSTWLRSSLVVYPGLTTFVATEVGVFDYLLSIKPDLYVNTWKGAVLNARWDIPVVWSENFDNRKIFRKFRQDSRFERLMLFQAVKLTPTVMANLGAGMILEDIYGTLNELMWTPGSGVHRFRAKIGYAENRGRDITTNKRNHSNDKVYLASYRFYYNPLDTYLEGTGGKFWDQDTGFTLELKRFFGDTAFSVYYKNTRTVDKQHVQMGGVEIAFPLTPRRDMKPYIVQVRGNDAWSYAQETEIASHGKPNLVGRSIGINPQPPYSLDRIFYNRDRLTEDYIRKHLLRLRDANLRYSH